MLRHKTDTFVAKVAKRQTYTTFVAFYFCVGFFFTFIWRVKLTNMSELMGLEIHNKNLI